MHRTTRFIIVATFLLTACTPVVTPVPATVTAVPTHTASVAPSATSTPEPTATIEPTSKPRIVVKAIGFKELPDGFVVIPAKPDEYLLEIHGNQLEGAVLLVGEREIPVSHLTEGEDGSEEGFFSLPRGFKDVRIRLADGSTQSVELPEVEPENPFITQDEKIVMGEDTIEIKDGVTCSRAQYKDGPNSPIVEIEPKDKDGFFLWVKVVSSDVKTDGLADIGGTARIIDTNNSTLQWIPVHVHKGWGVTAGDVNLCYWLPTTSWGTDFMLHVPGSKSISIIVPES